MFSLKNWEISDPYFTATFPGMSVPPTQGEAKVRDGSVAVSG